MPLPQPILDALTKAEADKDAAVAADADVTAKQTALTTAQTDLTTSTAAQLAAHQAVTADVQSLVNLIKQEFPT